MINPHKKLVKSESQTNDLVKDTNQMMKKTHLNTSFNNFDIDMMLMIL